MVGHAAGYGTGLRLKMKLAAQGLPVRLDPGPLELALLKPVRNAAVVWYHVQRYGIFGARPTLIVFAMLPSVTADPAYITLP